MHKIRLLHCIETISSGGVEKVRLDFARNLDFGRFEFKIICTNATGVIKDQLESLGVEIIQVGQFKTPFEWSKYKKVVNLIIKYKPHIIHGAVFEGMSMAIVGGIIGRSPIIIIEETSDPQNRSNRAIFLQRLYSILSDKVIAISLSNLDFLIKRVKVNPKKAILINNGVSLSSFQNRVDLVKLQNDIGINKGNFVIGAVGRVYDDIKRFSDLISAIALLKIKNVKLLLVGYGPDLEKLKNQVSELGIKDQFISVGYQSNPHIFYPLMDAFCIPSAREGFGLVAAEAMLHKLPVIATKVGGLQDIVVEGETGFLVPTYAPDQIALKIKILIENKDLRKYMGENGCKRAIKKYSSVKYYQKVEKLYLQLLNDKGLISKNS